jgi:hypothetical protein
VHSPHEFLLVCELDIGDGCVFRVEGVVRPVRNCAGEEGAVFGGT